MADGGQKNADGKMGMIKCGWQTDAEGNRNGKKITVSRKKAKKLTVSRKKAKILTFNRKSHYHIETLL